MQGLCLHVDGYFKPRELPIPTFPVCMCLVFRTSDLRFEVGMFTPSHVGGYPDQLDFSVRVRTLELVEPLWRSPSFIKAEVHPCRL